MLSGALDYIIKILYMLNTTVMYLFMLELLGDKVVHTLVLFVPGTELGPSVFETLYFVTTC